MVGKCYTTIVNNEISASINNLVSMQKIIGTVTAQLPNLSDHLCFVIKPILSLILSNTWVWQNHT